MSQFKNIYIYVSDALRYDHIPDSIASEGKVIPTLTPASYTPISFTSLVTGLNPSNHNVRSFYETIEKPTFLQEFENHCYYDHPESAMAQKVFKEHTTSKEIEDMEEPFIHVERALDTHYPYGEVHHGNDIPKNPENKGTHQERYEKGVKSTEEHFWQHIEELKKQGLYEDTLIIFTSDHGELNGEKKLFKERYGHNKPVCRELNIVPTVFLNTETEITHMRTIDLIPTALAKTNKETGLETDGINAEKQKPQTGESMVQLGEKPLPLIATTIWSYKNNWQPENFSKIKSDMVVLLSDILDPIKNQIRS